MFNKSYILHYTDIRDNDVSEALSYYGADHEMGQYSYNHMDKSWILEYLENDCPEKYKPGFRKLLLLMKDNSVDSFLFLMSW